MSGLETTRKSGRPARATLAGREEQLLATALALLVEYGYANLTLAMLAREARVAVRTIYVKYGGMAGLMLALLAEEQRRHRQQLERLAPQGMRGLAELAFDARLELLAGHLLGRASDQRLLRLQTIVAAQADSAMSQAFYQAGPGQLVALLLELFNQSDARAMLNDELDAEQLCRHFIDCIAGNRLLDAARSSTPQADARRAVQLFLRGTQRQAPDTRFGRQVCE